MGFYIALQQKRVLGLQLTLAGTTRCVGESFPGAGAGPVCPNPRLARCQARVDA